MYDRSSAVTGADDIIAFWCHSTLNNRPERTSHAFCQPGQSKMGHGQNHLWCHFKLDKLIQHAWEPTYRYQDHSNWANTSTSMSEYDFENSLSRPYWKIAAIIHINSNWPTKSIRQVPHTHARLGARILFCLILMEKCIYPLHYMYGILLNENLCMLSGKGYVTSL